MSKATPRNQEVHAMDGGGAGATEAVAVECDGVVIGGDGGNNQRVNRYCWQRFELAGSCAAVNLNQHAHTRTCVSHVGYFRRCRRLLFRCQAPVKA